MFTIRFHFLGVQSLSKAYKNEVLRLACAPSDVWSCFMKVFDMYENCELKDQKGEENE